MCYLLHFLSYGKVLYQSVPAGIEILALKVFICGMFSLKSLLMPVRIIMVNQLIIDFIFRLHFILSILGLVKHLILVEGNLIIYL